MSVSGWSSNVFLLECGQKWLRIVCLKESSSDIIMTSAFSAIEAFCDSLDEPHIFHQYSCYVMHKTKETFDKAFTDGCGIHGHLALVNDRATIEAISHEFRPHFSGPINIIGGWVGFKQLDHSQEYEPDKGWYFKLPNGKQWLGENIRWSRQNGVRQPDNWHGNEQCGNLHYVKEHSDVFVGGLNDVECNMNLTYECQYESMCSCQPVLYMATEDPQLIISPNYPKYYSPNMLCYYIVRTEKYHTIKLTLELLELGDYEWVQVFEDSANTFEPHNAIKTWEGGSLPSDDTSYMSYNKQNKFSYCAI